MIRLQFVDERWPFYRLISFGTRGNVCHVDAVLPDGRLLGARPFVTAPGVQIRPADYHTFTRKLLALIDCTPVQEAAFYSFLHAQRGKPYDFRALAAFFVGSDWRDDSAWTCSELMTAALVHGGIIRPLSKDAGRIAPADLLLVLSALPTVSIGEI